MREVRVDEGQRVQIDIKKMRTAVGADRVLRKVNKVVGCFMAVHNFPVKGNRRPWF